MTSRGHPNPTADDLRKWRRLIREVRGAVSGEQNLEPLKLVARECYRAVAPSRQVLTEVASPLRRLAAEWPEMTADGRVHAGPRMLALADQLAPNVGLDARRSGRQSTRPHGARPAAPERRYRADIDG